MPRRKKKYTMGNYSRNTEEDKAMLWCIDRKSVV